MKSKNIIYTILLIILFLFSGMLLLNKFSEQQSFSILSVESGSMEPEISTGSLIIVRAKEEYFPGDIITVRIGNDDKNLTHRVIGVEQSLEGTMYTTKGDANDAPDSKIVPQADVIGSVRADIPLLGYPVKLIREPIGLLLLIFIPALFIIISESQNIFQEIRKMRNDSAGKLEKGSNLSKNVVVILITSLTIVALILLGITGHTLAGLSKQTDVTMTIDASGNETFSETEIEAPEDEPTTEVKGVEQAPINEEELKDGIFNEEQEADEIHNEQNEESTTSDTIPSGNVPISVFVTSPE